MDTPPVDTPPVDTPSAIVPRTTWPASLGPATRLNQALDLDPAVLPYVVSLHPEDFGRLNIPLMRKLMAPRISLARVARMAGVPLAGFLQRLSEITGVPVGEVAASELPESPAVAPAWVEEARGRKIPAVDLLPIDARLDADPMRPVMLAAKALPPGGVLLIRHRWEPQPFYDAWSRAGFEWFSEPDGAGAWRIWLRRKTS